DATAGARRSDVQIHLAGQDARTARTSVAGGQHDIARQLVLDIYVELLHAALFEIEILNLKRSRIQLGIRRRGNCGEEKALVAAIERSGGACIVEGTRTEEIVQLG